MATQAIVLSSDSGTFWTGASDGRWSDDPTQAETFASPREAWRAAVELQKSQAEYLDGSTVWLHVRDADNSRMTRRVTSVADANNRPALRAQWRQGFGEALPPDLPSPLGDPADSPHRLADYLRDVDWDALRVRHGSAREMSEALDPGFWLRLSGLAARDRQAADTLLGQHAPRDVADQVRADWQRPGQAAADPARSGDPPALPHEDINEISRDRSRDRDASLSRVPPEGVSGRRGASPESEQDQSLPAFVRRHFVRVGDQFYHRRTPEKPAFSTRGESIRAHDTTTSVATAMVELAESRGWSALKVRGSRDFRRMVWTAAAKRGLAVDGYTPSAAERAMLEQESAGHPLPNSARAESRSGGSERDRPDYPAAGVLLDHGAAPYQHEPGNSPSYFVSVRGASGEVVTHWGLDLKRATEASVAAIGDQVELSRLGRQRVQVREPIRNGDGFVVDYETKETERNAWSVTVRERGSAGRATDGADPLAAKVVELFTAKRLATLPAEERVRFRELYQQAKARLEQGDRPQEAPEQAFNEVSRHRGRERLAWGR